MKMLPSHCLPWSVLSRLSTVNLGRDFTTRTFFVDKSPALLCNHSSAFSCRQSMSLVHDKTWWSLNAWRWVTYWSGSAANGGVQQQQPHQHYTSLRKNTSQRLAARPPSSLVSSNSEFAMQHVRIASQGTHFSVPYLDLGPKDAEDIVVGVHGSPGTPMDFEVFFQPLLEEGARIIVPHFPGHGLASIEDRDMLNDVLSTQGLAQFTMDFLSALHITRVDMFLGHSLGCLPILSIAAHTDIIGSMVLLNSGGIQPHVSARPYWIIKAAAWGSHHPIFKHLFEPLLLRGYQRRGFTVENIDLLKASIFFSSRLDFPHVQTCAKLLKQKAEQVPSLYAVVQSDRIIDWKTGVKTAEMAGLHCKDITFYDTDENITKGPLPGGPACYPKVLVFQRGGHFVHKTHPEVVLSHVLRLWISVTKHSATH